MRIEIYMNLWVAARELSAELQLEDRGTLFNPFILNLDVASGCCLSRIEMKWLSRVRLCNPMDCSPPGSSVHGIFKARVLEWVTISIYRGYSPPRYRTQVSHIVGRHFTV